MEQKSTRDGITNVLLCRQELEATCKKINKTPEGNNKSQRHVNISSNLKNRSNLSHPSIPPPPPPEKHLKSINSMLRQDIIGEMSPHEQQVSTLNNMAFSKIGQESQNSIKGNSLPIQPHQRHLSNSQYVIASSSNVKSPSFAFERISKEDHKPAISKASLEDDARLLNRESSDMFLSGSVDSFLIQSLFLNPY